MISSQPVLIPVDGPAGNHELNGLLGYLRYHNITAQVIPPARLLCYSHKEEQTFILLAGKSDREFTIAKSVINGLKPNQRCIVAGREATFQWQRFVKLLDGRGPVVIGDPHEIIKKVFLGYKFPITETHFKSPKWNPNEYQFGNVEGLNTSCNSTAYIFYSTGCERECGYCPFGYNFSHVAGYGSDHWRIRPISSLRNEIRVLARAGYTVFRLVADQILHSETSKNILLEQLCQIIAKEAGANAVVKFTASSFDVCNNKNLLIKCRSALNLKINLSLDFIVDDMMRRFRLPSRERDHAEAVKILSNIDAFGEIYCIFIHPWLQERQIQRFLNWMETVLPVIIKYDVIKGEHFFFNYFSSVFHFDATTPPDTQLRKLLTETIPEQKALNFVELISYFFSNSNLKQQLHEFIISSQNWPILFANWARERLNELPSDHRISEKECIRLISELNHPLSGWE